MRDGDKIIRIVGRYELALYHSDLNLVSTGDIARGVTPSKEMKGGLYAWNQGHTHNTVRKDPNPSYHIYEGDYDVALEMFNGFRDENEVARACASLSTPSMSRKQRIEKYNQGDGYP